MGAKYTYHAAFLDDGTERDLVDLTLIGFEVFWQRAGKPSVISRQDFENSLVTDYPFSTGKLLELVPPKVGELSVIYPNIDRGCSLMFCREGNYIVVSSSVEARGLSRHSRRRMCEDLRTALDRFVPSVIVAGEEIEIDQVAIERMRNGLGVGKAHVDWMFVYD